MSSKPFWHHHATSLDGKSERSAAVLLTENTGHRPIGRDTETLRVYHFEHVAF